MPNELAKREFQKVPGSATDSIDAVNVGDCYWITFFDDDEHESEPEPKLYCVTNIGSNYVGFETRNNARS